MNQSGDNKIIPMTSVESGHGKEVRNDIYYYTNQIVNVIMVGDPAQGEWVLVDAGMPYSGKELVNAAELLEPELVISGHGQFMEGLELKTGLRRLSEDFSSVAIPDHGKYVVKTKNI